MQGTSTTTTTAMRPKVGVMGIGAMGAAVVRRLLNQGATTEGGQLTLWNRTASKAQAFVSDGAKVANSVSELVQSSDVIIIVLTDYKNAHDLLDNDQVGPHLKGRLLLQLSTGEAAEARNFEKEIAKKWNADFLAGAIMDFPTGMVQGKASVYISGSSVLFDRSKPFLDKLGLVAYAGEEVGNASVLDEAGLSMFMAMEVGLINALAVCEKEKFPKEHFWTFVQQLCPVAPAIFAPLYDKICARNYTESVDASLDLTGKAFERIRKSYEKRGIYPGLIQELEDTTKKTIEHSGQPDADVAQIFEFLISGKK